MYGKRGRELRRCTALTLSGYGPQCRNFTKVGFNLCSLHLAADNRQYPNEGERAFNKLMGIKRHKSQYLRCQCLAYPFVHPAGGGICQWPYQPDRRLECKPNKEAISFRAKLRRKGIVVNTIKELADRGIGENSKIIDLDSDPNDLSMEQEYLSTVQKQIDVLSLPIEERRKVQKQRLIAEYMIKAGKATIDDSDGARKADGDADRDDGNWVEIDGEIYKIG
jgi:hypothetical protein